eukprot:365756-Chlamydomonas_euryale.AAC.6
MLCVALAHATSMCSGAAVAAPVRLSLRCGAPAGCSARAGMRARGAALPSRDAAGEAGASLAYQGRSRRARRAVPSKLAFGRHAPLWQSHMRPGRQAAAAPAAAAAAAVWPTVAHRNRTPNQWGQMRRLAAAHFIACRGDRNES